jgi:GTP cyclohydrolase I
VKLVDTLAEQLCMTVRGEKRTRARAHAEAFAGALAKDGSARRRFLAAVAAAREDGSAARDRGRKRARRGRR